MLDISGAAAVVVQAMQPIQGECSGVGGTAFDVGPAMFYQVPAHHTVHVDFPYPAGFPTSTPSGDWCLRAFVFNLNVTISVTAVGYVQ